MAEAKPDEVEYYKKDELLQVDFHPPQTDWMDTPTIFKHGNYCYTAKKTMVEHNSKRFRIKRCN